MPISKNESGIMKAVLGLHEAASSNDISSELGISQENVSRAITALAKKGLLERENGTVVLAKTPQAERFREMYFAHPVSPFEKIIADKRVLLLSKIGERQKSVKELSRESQIPISTVHYYLRDLVRLGVVSKQKKGKEGVYRFNYVLWRPLKEFVDILSDFEETLKVPQGDC